MTSQSLRVTDTNIWIDLENGGILAEVFRLPYRFLTPDFAIPELRRPGGKPCRRWVWKPANWPLNRLWSCFAYDRFTGIFPSPTWQHSCWQRRLMPHC